MFAEKVSYCTRKYLLKTTLVIPQMKTGGEKVCPEMGHLSNHLIKVSGLGPAWWPGPDPVYVVLGKDSLVSIWAYYQTKSQMHIITENKSKTGLCPTPSKRSNRGTLTPHVSSQVLVQHFCRQSPCVVRSVFSGFEEHHWSAQLLVHWKPKFGNRSSAS